MKRSTILWIYMLLLLPGIQAQQKKVIPDLVKQNVSLNTGRILQTVVDTSISGSQIFHPLYNQFPAWSELGNTGLPALPLRFTGIGESNTPSFLGPYLSYLSSDKQVSFYDTKNPFSQVSFNGEATGDRNKVSQIMKFFYTRNIGKDVNVTGLFDFISSDGQFANQSVTESLIGVNLSIEKPRYKHFTSFERVQLKIQENGGVKNDSEVISTPVSYYSTLGVNLNNARSKNTFLRVKGWQCMELFSKPSRDSTDTLINTRTTRKFEPVIIHSYNFTSANRLYNDEFTSLDFYPDTLISKDITQDSVQHFSFINDLDIRIKGALRDSSNWSVQAGLRHEIMHFYSHYGGVWEQGLGVGTVASMAWKGFEFLGQGRIMFAGYQSGDHELEVNAKYLSPDKNSGPEVRFSSKAFAPDLFISSYMGNHFQWKNVFSKQIEQGLGFSWNMPKWNFTFDTDIKLISNWIYFNKSARPQQRENSAFLASSGIVKTFKAGPFRSRNTIYLNYTNADEIPLPLLAASTSTYMHHDIHFIKTNGLLQVEYGFDLRFVNEYKGFAYMPATGVFYLQDERILGNYPVLDLFLIMRVKRTRFFVKWEHVNSGYTGDNFFPVLHYPIKQRNLKYGVYWHFHD